MTARCGSRSPVILFGYTLGRTQELELTVFRSERNRLFVTDATRKLNAIIEASHDVVFNAERYGRETTLGAGDALILPAQVNNLSFVDHIVENTGAVKTGFSGWAIEDSFKYRVEYDEMFVLSNHSDFRNSPRDGRRSPSKSGNTHHGFADELATHLESEFDIEARSLKKNRSSLDQF